MATFQKRRRKDGGISVTAQIRIHENGALIHSETKTFSKSTAALNEKNAKLWAKKREAAIELSGIPQKANAVTLAELTDVYLDDPAIKRKGRSKVSDMKRITKYPIAHADIASLAVSDYNAHVNQRLTEASPQTVGNDLIWMAQLLDYAAVTHDITGTRPILEDARRLMRKTGKIEKSKSRERLPTPEEHSALLDYFARATHRSRYPMRDILLFAQYSARRQSEITRIAWESNNPEFETGLVSALKNPAGTAGNDRRFQYTPEAWAIAMRQPRESELIFPYNPRTIAMYFQRACAILGITGLTFHDYRHLAISWLFTLGYDIPVVSQYSLHESWSALKRYTHLSAEEREQVRAVFAVTADEFN